MPFSRSTLTQLRKQVSADIAAGLPGVNALLRYSNLGVLGDVVAAVANGIYGYLDWIAKQAVPFTATGEYLEGWAALKGVRRKAAGKATGQVTFNGTAGKTIDAGTSLSRSDGATYTVTADVTLAGPSAIVSVRADTAGTTGNCDVGTTLSLESAISGISSQGTVSTAIAGGTAVQGEDELRTRMIAAYSNPASGGSKSDYENWALDVDGVTRAWCTPNIYGAGTVGILFMMDDARAGSGGFPSGTNGVSASETRDVSATGDQLTVADAIYEDQPVTALVYAIAPTSNIIDLTISGLSSPSSDTKTAISNAFSNALTQNAKPGGETMLSDIEAAIAAVTAASGFVITLVQASAGTVSPAKVGNITSNSGALPVAGAISYAS